MKFSHTLRFHDGRVGCALTIRVTPRSSRNEITGVMSDGTIKVRLRKAPVEDQANQELVKFLSKVLDCPLSNIEIIAGQSSRNKIIGLIDQKSEIVQLKILQQIKPGV